MDDKLTFGDFMCFLYYFVFPILLLTFLIYVPVRMFFAEHKYYQELESICREEYDSCDCKVQSLTSDNVIFYDKDNNKYIYEKLENILQ